MSNSIFEVSAGSTVLFQFSFTISSILLGLIGFIVDKLPVGSLGGGCVLASLMLRNAAVQVFCTAVVALISIRAVEDVDVVHCY